MPLLLAILIALFLPAAASAAEAYPSHAIRMVVPFPPAGIADLSARIVGDGLRARLGRTIVIENKPAANGIVGLREMLKAEPDGYTLKETGVEMVHVPYKGGPGALNDLLAGSIDVIIEVFPVVMEQIRSGAIKGLAVSSSYRQPSLPNVPTFAEVGLRGVTLTGWVGIYGPPGIAPDVRDKLGSSVVDVVRQDDTKERFRKIGFEPTGLGVAAFSKLHTDEIARWVSFLTEIGLRK